MHVSYTENIHNPSLQKIGNTVNPTYVPGGYHMSGTSLKEDTTVYRLRKGAGTVNTF